MRLVTCSDYEAAGLVFEHCDGCHDGSRGDDMSGITSPLTESPHWPDDYDELVCCGASHAFDALPLPERQALWRRLHQKEGR